MAKEVEAWVFLDSSSARQLAAKRGVGKIKHMSGRLLWIQVYVARGEVRLAQVSALLNLADIGTQTPSQAIV